MNTYEIFKKKVSERINHFSSIVHSFEAKELHDALNTILRLVPPSSFEPTPLQAEEEYYSGVSYQRLFNQINEAGLNPTVSQMDDIIHVVKEDFLEVKGVEEAAVKSAAKEYADANCDNKWNKAAELEYAFIAGAQYASQFQPAQGQEEERYQHIRDTITAATEGFMEWVKKETVIRRKSTWEIIEDSAIDLVENPKSLRTEYIYPRLANFGIIITTDEPPTTPTH